MIDERKIGIFYPSEELWMNKLTGDWMLECHYKKLGYWTYYIQCDFRLNIK